MGWLGGQPPARRGRGAGGFGPAGGTPGGRGPPPPPGRRGGGVLAGRGRPAPYGGIRQIGSQPSTARANNVRPYILYSDS